MSDENNKKPVHRYEPGELDKTRKNLGNIDKSEAQKMVKVLGGEIGIEKVAPVDSSKMPQRPKTYARRDNRNSKNTNASVPAGSLDAINLINSKKTTKGETLPPLQSKDRTVFDKLMMSPDFKIKPNYGIFIFIYYLISAGSERISDSFFTEIFSDYIGHMESFSSSVKNLLTGADQKLKEEVIAAETLKAQLLNKIINWNIADIKKEYHNIELHNDYSMIAMIPLVRLCYRQLLPLFYLGENRVTDYIKEVYSGIAANPEIPAHTKEILQKYTRTAASEWIIIYSQIMKGLYPLLMRMCCPEFTTYPDFFYSKIAKILPFLKLTKYDILLPEKKQAEDSERIEKEQLEAQKQAQAEKEQKEAEDREKILSQTASRKYSAKTGLAILELLFPDSHWADIHDFPDFYPYFQPLYQIQDGFNLISRYNPLQVIIILLRILEDLFQGCHNIIFSTNAILELQTSQDSLNDIFAEWSLYREILFEKKFCGSLKAYINHLTTQSDFRASKYGKKEITELLWQEKFDFLPNLIFNLEFVGKPYRDSTYKPLNQRVSYLKNVFTYFADEIDSRLTQNPPTPIPGTANIWKHYHFEVPNNLSRRLDVLLSTKNTQTANNANLLKITLSIISVLDWILNDPNNPLITKKLERIFRTTEEDLSSPIYAVPMRNDQNKRFITNAKTSTATLFSILGIEKITPQESQ